MKIAGKFMRGIRNNPVKSAVAGGLAAAGAATLGNLVSGEAAQEGPGRLGLEALQAGLYGASAGSLLPGIKKHFTKGAAASRLLDKDRLASLYQQGILNEGNAQQVSDMYKAMINASPRVGQLASTGLLLGAGGAGGMVGGGIANVGQLLGIPGLQQAEDMQAVAQQAINPEGYGSSNSQGARYKAPTTQYV